MKKKPARKTARVKMSVPAPVPRLRQAQKIPAGLIVSKPTPQNKAATDVQTNPVSQRQAWFDNVMFFSTSGGTLDPFAVESADDPFRFSSKLDVSPTLEDKNNQTPFGTPDPMAYGGSLNSDWHQFACGPLFPFIASLGLFSPIAPQGAPDWAVKAAGKCLKKMRCEASAPRPQRVGWCVGFGIAATKWLDNWDVELGGFAKVSPELKRHLFNRAADTTDNDIEATRAFLNGFCDGVRAAQGIQQQSAPFNRCLYCALKWDKLLGLSRKAVFRKLLVCKLANSSQETDVLKELKNIEMPRESGAKS